MPKNNFLARWTIVIALVLASSQTPQGQTPTPQLGKNSVKEVVAAMTTEEKVKTSRWHGTQPQHPGLPPPAAEEQDSRRKLSAPRDALTQYRDLVFPL